MKKRQLDGQRFGRLLVLAEHGRRRKKVIWACQCDCGKMSYAHASDLVSGKHRSCGCLQKEFVSKHGKYKTITYMSWQSMIQRCCNPKAPMYHYYGGRGITVCQRWHSFELFFEDVKERPSKKYTLQRIDNDGNYEPGNVCWATRKEQAQNQRRPAKQFIPPRDPRTGRFTSYG